MATYTLLEIVQKIINDMDSEEVNSISDTSEATQIANIVEDTFYNIISNRLIPEHEEMVKLTSESNSNTPTHFTYPSRVTKVFKVWYDTSDDDTYEYVEMPFVSPETFLSRTDKVTDNYDSVSDPVSATKLRVVNNKMPEYYTSFDDKYIVFDSYDSTVDTTLTTEKSRALCVRTPPFTIADSFTPDLDDNYFPLLINESKSVCMSLLKGQVDPKVEQSARRQRSRVQNDLFKTTRKRGLSSYGRS